MRRVTIARNATDTLLKIAGESPPDGGGITVVTACHTEE